MRILKNRLLSGRDVRSYVAAHWRGELSLGRTFWINGVLLDFVLSTILLVVLLVVVVATAFVDERVFLLTPQLSNWLLIAPQTVVTPWQLVGLWRSARRSFASGRRLWPGMALLVAWGLTLNGVAGIPAVVVDDLAALRRFRDMLSWRTTILPSRDGAELIVIGMIGWGFADALQRALVEHPNVRLISLASGGGLGTEARKAAKEIRRRKLAARAGGECSSACTMIFLASHERILGPYGALGFHSPSSLVETGIERERALVISYEDELKGAGIAADFAHRAAATAADSMWYPAPEELLAAGVVTRIEHRTSDPVEIILQPR